jgi:hypothetical protein
MHPVARTAPVSGGVDQERLIPLPEAVDAPRWRPRCVGDRPAPGVSEAKAVAGQALDRVAALVDEPVVAPAEQKQVAECGLASVSPVTDVMRVDEKLIFAPGEAATAVAPRERSP